MSVAASITIEVYDLREIGKAFRWVVKHDGRERARGVAGSMADGLKAATQAVDKLA